MGVSQGPVTSTQQTEEQRVLDQIRANGSVYFKAFSMVPEAFAASAAKEFDALKAQSTIKPGMTDYAYLQALVRQSGLSKGTGPLNQVDPKDLSAIKDVYQSAYLSGVDWQTWLERYSQSPYASSSSGPKFSKEISTALSVLDKTDAESILNKAYYEAFGKMPNTKQIENFKNKYNVEAKRQLAETVSTRSTSGTDTSSMAKSKTVTTGQGFTENEQNEFIADFLQKSYKITGKESSGRVKTIVDDIKRVYTDNLLPVPSFQEIVAFAGEAIGTGDSEMYKQKIDTKLQSIRNAAGKLYPGFSEQLSSGTDIRTVAEPSAQTLNAYLGTNFTFNDPRMNEVLNYNDGKTIRPMNASEIEKYAAKQPEFDTSDYGRNKAMTLAQKFKEGLR